MLRTIRFYSETLDRVFLSASISEETVDGGTDYVVNFKQHTWTITPMESNVVGGFTTLSVAYDYAEEIARIMETHLVDPDEEPVKMRDSSVSKDLDRFLGRSSSPVDELDSILPRSFDDN